MKKVKKISFLSQPQKLKKYEFLWVLQTIKDLDSISSFYLKRKIIRFLQWCFNNVQRKGFVKENLRPFVSCLYQNMVESQVLQTDPQLQFIFKQYETIFRKEIKPNWNSIEFSDEKLEIQMSEQLETVYHQQIQANRRKLKQEKAQQALSTNQLNQFILGVTSSQKLLPDAQRLDQATFFYKNWKVSQPTNPFSKFVGVGPDRGKNKNELLKRICAFANTTGGILLWGVDQKTHHVEGVKLNEEERLQVLEEMKSWSNWDENGDNLFHGRVLIIKEFIEVRSDPLESSGVQEQNLWVLRIEVYPDLLRQMRFYCQKKHKKGMNPKYPCYEFDTEMKVQRLEDQRLYKLLKASYRREPLKFFGMKEKLFEELLRKQQQKLQSIGYQLQPFLDSDTEFMGENDDQIYSMENIQKTFKYRYQTCLTVSQSKIPAIAQFADELSKQKIRNKLLSFYPQFQDERQIRVFSHNIKLDDMKKMAKKFSNCQFNLEEVTKTLKPLFGIKEKELKKLCKKFKSYFPSSNYDVQNQVKDAENKLKDCYFIFRNTIEAIFSKVYLEKIGVRTQFIKTL